VKIDFLLSSVNLFQVPAAFPVNEGRGLHATGLPFLANAGVGGQSQASRTQ
jgi:hypothetical protein